MQDFDTTLEQQITTADMNVIKMIQGVTRRDRKRNEDLTDSNQQEQISVV